jgi:hypothetical protein
MLACLLIPVLEHRFTDRSSMDGSGLPYPCKPIRLFFVIAFDHQRGVARDPSSDARVLDSTDQIARATLPSLG